MSATDQEHRPDADHLARVFALSGASLPLFWFGIILLITSWVNLGWVSIGRSDPEIAAALCISRRTAATHVAAIFRKLGVASRAAAAAHAVRHGLV